jgi:ribA/ribD-fused uncharacterized protein
MRITDEYVFFWDGIYSQWYQAPMNLDGRTYNCCEQYMMHRKATMFEDFETAARIMITDHPRVQKEYGRAVANFNKEKWEAVCRDIVFQANFAKFTQNKRLQKEMLATGDRKFVEASPFDTIWGIGRGETDDLILDPANWMGKNWLGEALDKVKAGIQKKVN